MIYLDTHMVVWLFSGELNLIPENIVSKLRKNDLLISPIVELELQYLYEIKRIKKTSKVITNTLKKEIGLQFCKHKFNEVINASLANQWTRDPFDRIITAQASINSSILITKDKTILENYRYALW